MMARSFPCYAPFAKGWLKLRCKLHDHDDRQLMRAVPGMMSEEGCCMRFQSVTVCCLLFTTGLFAQTDRGAITGTVLDPAEAAIAGAAVVARGVDTGSRYQTAT